ncbi:MAG TPA: hypothetical protein DCQ26_09700 [Marinilabiliales bacterium]|jgi:hypothetical protein|nr:MAG: hypothetical protein A2W95_13425 [Bacteroidetes bacterium GWA2_40_14]OFX66174.1 MAG: hypothetical protein A2W84_18645 [Bacteroidetes bacterium GWC2_40_13]OFX74518.1 MAG: hypothetical protein A2W96_19630 [Bacteroidetes bacterium GWD2_40_43]OFX92031.1 MAG: hypothetical protein A2W97_08150 [Bacteroidetes bacterium GWE2_40_63]OFY16655.1 MAG: hypothetical protein A2W88_15825 [Bacteroidetes bacterium GWF2_40_13]OFZ27029.1 MAG: hypothetical protein A2437_16600 [Bacteroidetes bacterium RIFOXYC
MWTKHKLHHFPFTFKDEVVFYKTDDFSDTSFLLKIAAHFQQKAPQNTIISQILSVPIKIPIKVTFHYQPDPLTGKVSIELSLFELNVTLLLFTIFSYFFFHYDNSLLGFLSLAAGLFVYVISIHETTAHIKAQIYLLSGTSSDMGESALWKKQQEWMKDPKVCPACGEAKNPYSGTCISCGIFFGKKNSHVEQMQINSTGNSSVNIHYQPTKNEKNSRQ